MNIDERIEALTQSVELLASMHQDLEQKWDERMGKMLDIQDKLAQIIVIHEERINGHDQRLDKLEH
jgi:hypothetical protein